jgi:hypothetical protein
VLVRHCFPGFWESIDAIEGPRDADKTVYDLRHVLSLAILMFACRMVSRRACPSGSSFKGFGAPKKAAMSLSSQSKTCQTHFLKITLKCRRDQEG